jgi:DNA-binding Lrp family transcriptional regulator
VATLLVKDIYELGKWIKNFNYLFSRSISDKDLSISTTVMAFKNKAIHGVADMSYCFAVGQIKEAEIDDLDMQILKELAKNCKVSLIKLADILSKDTATVKSRLKRLVKEGVLQEFRAKINYSLLGYHYYHTFLYFKEINEDMEKQLKNYLHSIPALLYISIGLGKADIEFEIIAKNHLELHKTLEKLKAKFSKIILKSETMLIIYVYKTSFMP